MEGLLWARIWPQNPDLLCTTHNTSYAMNWSPMAFSGNCRSRPVIAPRASFDSALCWVTLVSALCSLWTNANPMLMILSPSSPWQGSIKLKVLSTGKLNPNRKWWIAKTQWQKSECESATLNTTKVVISLLSLEKGASPGPSHLYRGNEKKEALGPLLHVSIAITVQCLLSARKIIYMHYLIKSLKQNCCSCYTGKYTEA